MPPAATATTTHSTTVTLPRGQTRAAFAPASVNVSARTAELVWTTGARVLRHDLYDGPWLEELSLAEDAVDLRRLNAGAPLLATHRSAELDQVLGVVERAWLVGNGRREGRALVRFSKRPEVDGVLTDVQDGILRNVSVGYITHALERIDPGDAKTGTPPVYRATRWEPVELSLVPVGADPGAGMRTSPEAKKRHNCLVTASSSPSSATRPAAGAAQTIPARKEIPMPTARAAMTSAEFTAALDTYDIPGRGLSVTRRQGIVDAICQRADPARFRPTAAGGEWNASSMLSMAREVLAAQGVATRGLGHGELAGMALNLTKVQTRQGYLTTSDFPALLATVGRTVLTAGYQAAPKTFPPWTRQGSARDFRTEYRVSLGLGPQFLRVAEHGEYTRGKLAADAAQPIKLETFGRVLPFTRQALLNDDVGLFRRIPQLFGNAAAALEGDVVYGLLTANPTMADGFAVFSTQHKNLLPAAELTLDSLSTARQAMRTQTSVDGMTLAIDPRFLIVGPQLEVTAAQLLAPVTIVGAVNQVVPASIQSLQLVVDPRIADKSFYLAASPNQVDTIEYDYLAGAEPGPQLETYEAWTIDATEFKARMDFAAAVVDYRGLNKTPGVA